uniref:TRAF-interacting protein with FHA domain-containing protein A n=1 Tax=Eptatretus burgeri TaxID=7764 RepID=A0A8C4QSH0_EPTBU
MQSFSPQAETEELPPILHLTFYHPQGACVFLLLPEREKYHKFEGHKVVTLGRADSCTLRLNHKRVSREQLQIRAWRPRPDTIVSFEVVNTSKQPLQLNGTMVGYLCRSALSAKSLLTFGEFEVFINIENGEAQDSFALTCKDSDESFRSETFSEFRHPILETGLFSSPFPETQPIGSHSEIMSSIRK